MLAVRLGIVCIFKPVRWFLHISTRHLRLHPWRHLFLCALFFAPMWLLDAKRGELAPLASAMKWVCAGGLFLLFLLVSVRELTHRRRRIATSPGWGVLHIISWVYSAKTVSQVFRPTINDMQFEHIQALAEGNPLKARWVLLRGYSSVWSAAVAQAPLSLMKRLYELWKAAS